MDFNPNTTGTKGLEWYPHTMTLVALDSPGRVICQSMVQTTSQIIGTIIVDAAAYSGAPVIAVEVFDNADATIDTTTLTTATYRPNADVSGTGAAAWQEDDGTTSTIFSEIDEATLDLTDYIKLPEAAGVLTTTVYAGRVDNTAVLTGKRVLSVTLTAVVSRTAGFASQFRLGIDLAGGSQYFSPYFTPAADTVQTISYTWYYNPQANRPWRIADVTTNFNATDEFLLEASAKNNEARCYQLYMTVAYCTETRIAVGGAAVTATGLTSVTMTTATGGAWTKDATGSHVYVVRRISPSGSGSVSIYTVTGRTPASLTVDASPTSVTGYSPTINGTYGYATVMGSATAAVFMLEQVTTAPAYSVDSQPYRGWYANPALGATSQHTNYVGNGNGAEFEQEFSNAAATTYSVLRVMCFAGSGGLNAADVLTVRIRRRSDNVQLGSTVTITPAEVAASPALGGGPWKLIEKVLSSAATLAAGVQYYFEFESNPTSGTQPAINSAITFGSSYVWWVQGLVQEGSGEAAGFGGATDRATTGTVEAATYEGTMTLSTVPTAPANFADTLTLQTLPDDGLTGCDIPGVYYARLTWTATALGASFSRYEIERSEDVGVTWVQVFYLSTEATAAINDYEGLRNVSTQYRIRVVRTDGSSSAWAYSSGVTPIATCEWVLVSNVNAAYNCAYQQLGSSLTYRVVDADRVVMMEPYQRDHSISFVPTETRGEEFTLPLIVYGADTAPAAARDGIAAFDRIRALARVDVPYVAVLDADGNRFFAQLRVLDPTVRKGQRIHFYTAGVGVRTVKGSPVSVTSQST